MTGRSTWRVVVDDRRYAVLDASAGPYTVSKTRLRHGQQTRGHEHDRDEVYYFIGGYGRMTVRDRTFEVSTDVVVYVGPNEYHRVENTSAIEGAPLWFVSFFVGAPGRPEVTSDD